MGSAPARADESFAFDRLAGEDRYATAAAIALALDGAGTSALLATGEAYPDALAAAYLAGARSAPVLLTGPDALPAPTASALEELGATSVTLLGGTGAIGAAVEDELVAAGYTVDRIAGEDRYETASLVALAPGAGAVGTVGDQRVAFVASGAGFADAVAAGPLAAAGRLPTLLTTPDRLSPAAAAALGELDIERAVVLGGTAAVSTAAEAEIVALGIEVERVAGGDRTATAAAIADYAVEHLGFSAAAVNLARGDGFADALAGGPYGGSIEAVTLLTASPTTLGAATAGWLADHADTLGTGAIFGGTGAVSGAVEAEATEAAGGTAAPTSASDALGVAITGGLAQGAVTNDTTPTYSGTASATTGEVDKVTVKVGSGAASDAGIVCTGCGSDAATWTYTPPTPLAEGRHTIELRAVDARGGTSAPASTSVTVDTTPPRFESVTGARGTNRLVAQFSEPVLCTSVSAGDFTATVEGAKVSITEARCAGGSSVELVIGRTLAAGEKVSLTLVGAVTDLAGNQAPTPTVQTADVSSSDAPAMTVTSGPIHDSHTKLPRPKWEGTARATSGRMVATIEARIGSAVFATTGTSCAGCPGSAVSWSFQPTTALAQGVHTIEMRARDDAGVLSRVETRKVTVDTKAPVLASVTFVVNDKTIVATFTEGGGEANGIDCSTVTEEDFTVKVSSTGTFVNPDDVSCNPTGGTTVRLVLGTAPAAGQSVSVALRANGVYDRAANSADAVTSMTATAPATATITSPAADGTSTNVPEPTWTGGATAPTGRSVRKVQVKLDDDGLYADATCTSSSCATTVATWSFKPASPVPESPTPHTIFVRAIDDLGREGPVVTRTFTADRTAPEFVSVSAAPNSATITATFNERIALCPPDGFTVKVNTIERTVTSTTCTSSAVALQVGTVLMSGDCIEVTIKVGMVKDAATNAAPVPANPKRWTVGDSAGSPPPSSCSLMPST